jgi:signal transduction histidine kinase
MQPLARLRLGLTAWYAVTLGVILVLLGTGLFLAIRSQIARQLDHSLEAAARELMRAAGIREIEAVAAKGAVMDAVDELRIPDRALYLLDSAGRPLKPSQVDSRILEAAAPALRGPVRNDVAGGANKLRIFAEWFRTAGSTAYIAVAVGDQREVEDEYAALIMTFAVAALMALLLVTGGGYILVQKSTAPVERTMEYMRRFMADAAHELRTPLTVLRTRAEVTLQRAREPAEYIAALDAIEREAERLGRIVNDLLLLARADAGERPIQRSRVFLDDLVLDVAGGTGLVAERRGVKLDLEGVEEATVDGDPALVRQLISIVMENAVKFTPAGGQVEVGVGAADGASWITVQDTGVGISSEQLRHIFERFYRADPARARSEGAGLGLAIARWIADAHRAQIDVVSELGRGTKISIRFPSPVSAS